MSTISTQPKFKDETDNIYGELTVIEYAGPSRHGAMWHCYCSCGNVVVVRGAYLRKGQTSCGCQNITKLTHGRTDSAEYKVWINILSRCTNPSTPTFHRYGGRGIKVCQRWLDSFENFLSDVGTRPGRHYSIERKDNNGHYEPGNCIWVTRHTQDRNKRTNHWLTHNGVTLCVTDWARRVGMKPNTLCGRLKRGWSVEDALTVN